MTDKEIALEILDKYIEDEINLMYEFSEDFNKSKKDILKKAKKYLQKLNALNLIKKYEEQLSFWS